MGKAAEYCGTLRNTRENNREHCGMLRNVRESYGRQWNVVEHGRRDRSPDGTTTRVNIERNRG